MNVSHMLVTSSVWSEAGESRKLLPVSLFLIRPCQRESKHNISAMACQREDCLREMPISSSLGGGVTSWDCTMSGKPLCFSLAFSNSPALLSALLFRLQFGEGADL